MAFQVECDGRTIDVPSADELNLDEWQVVREKTGISTVPAYAIALRSVDPRAWRTLIEIGVARNPQLGNPRVGKVNLVELVNRLEAEADAEKEAAGEANGGPPVQTAGAPTPAAISESPSLEKTPDRSGTPA